MNSTQLALKLAARKALIIRSSGYLVVLNEKFLTQLASDFILQIEQVLRLIGITLKQVNSIAVLKVTPQFPQEKIRSNQFLSKSSSQRLS
ncbi:hypothetical protein PNC201_11850 [Pseudoalteromonas sp. NC201]|nr:hypothetical protein PNC201_11850 [Pseudoalteromonas sp. NC201]